MKPKRFWLDSLNANANEHCRFQPWFPIDAQVPRGGGGYIYIYICIYIYISYVHVYMVQRCNPAPPPPPMVMGQTGTPPNYVVVVMRLGCGGLGSGWFRIGLC